MSQQILDHVESNSLKKEIDKFDCYFHGLEIIVLKSHGKFRDLRSHELYNGKDAKNKVAEVSPFPFALLVLNVIAGSC